MGKYFLLVWHPEAKSFNLAMHNSAVAALTKAGHEVKVSNLAEMEWNPVSGPKNFTAEHTRVKPDFFKQQLEEPAAAKAGTFSPEIAAEQAKLAWADVVIFQFPLWWFSMPATMKGWCDKVLAYGVSYGGEVGIYATGPYKNKKAILSITTGGPAPTYEKGGFNGDINGVLRPIQRGILEFCGFSVLAPEIVFAAAHGTDDDRQKRLAKWEERVVGLQEELPIEVGAY